MQGLEDHNRMMGGGTAAAASAASSSTPLLDGAGGTTRGHGSTTQQLPPPNYDATVHRQRMHDLRNQQPKPSSVKKGGSRRHLQGTSVLGNVFIEEKEEQHEKKQQKKLQKIKKTKSTSSDNTPQVETGTVAPIKKTTMYQGVMDNTTASNKINSNQKEKTTKQKQHHHSFIYSMLNPHSRQWQAKYFKLFISIVIMTDLLIFIISTDPKIVRKGNKSFFKKMEGLVSTIFLFEYLARIFTITEKKKYNGWFGRLIYATTNMGAIIDILATAPFFIEVLTSYQLPRLTFLRMFRLFRILRTESYVRAVDAVYRVVYYNSEILYVAALLCIFLTLVTAVLLYILRPVDDSEYFSDPDADASQFQSITACLYLSTLMLTGQGGPTGALPWYTKLVVIITSVFSVAMFAIPASMLTWGFEAEAERMAKRARQRALQDDDECQSSTSSEEGGDTTDEEYFRMIAGADEEDEEDETPWMKQVRETFQLNDLDHDGTLTLAEARTMLANQMPGGGGGGGSAMTTESAGALTARMDRLESKLNENNNKLDLVIQLLQGRRDVLRS